MNKKNKITLKKILTLNPQISKSLLKKAQELSSELDKIGTGRHEYGIKSPYSYHPTSISRKGNPRP